MAKHDHHNTAKAVIAFLIVLIMARIFFLFYENSEAIIKSNQFYMFMTLTIVAAGLLLGLLYLASKHPQKAVTHKAVVSKAAKKTSKKKKSSR
jgi:hypothetical protein